MSAAAGPSIAPVVAGADPAMAIVTTCAASGEHDGCLVGFHSQCSIDPERYAVWLSVTNRTYRCSLDATHLAVHFLSSADHALGVRFGGFSGDDFEAGGDGKLDGVPWRPGPGDVPVLDEVARWFVGRIVRRGERASSGGDHVWVELEPVEVAVVDEDDAAWAPLRLADVSDIEPGHEA